jgi:hypothetical protein
MSYQLQRNVVSRASWPIKFIKGACPGLKRPAQVTNAEKRFKYEKEKRPERIFNAKWCEGRPWLKYDRDENVMTCTICTKYGKRGVTGNLKKLAVEVEHEIEREFI